MTIRTLGILDDEDYLNNNTRNLKKYVYSDEKSLYALNITLKCIQRVPRSLINQSDQFHVSVCVCVCVSVRSDQRGCVSGRTSGSTRGRPPTAEGLFT